MVIHVGTSGWSYQHWNGVLYPPGTPPSQRLALYTNAFTTVELNSSFYHWPRDAAFADWRRRLPQDFRLSVKAARGLTHGKRLLDPDRWISRMASGWHELGDRRAVVLVQLAPDHHRDDSRLSYFLGRLPPWMQTAVEFRHPSWVHPEVFGILEEHQVAYCVLSGAGLPCELRSTAPLVYVRLHGPDNHHLYGGSYSDNDLRWWADRIGEWAASGKEVFFYFNNDGHGHAVRNAQTLRSLL